MQCFVKKNDRRSWYLKHDSEDPAARVHGVREPVRVLSLALKQKVAISPRSNSMASSFDFYALPIHRWWLTCPAFVPISQLLISTNKNSSKVLPLYFISECGVELDLKSYLTVVI